MSSLRIVLVDPLGDVLFSGESLASSPCSPRSPENKAPIAPPSEADEPCPETKRSAGSGVYRAVDRRAVSNVAVIEDVGAQIRAESFRRSKGLRRVG